MIIEFEPSKKYRERFEDLPENIKERFSEALVELEYQIKETPGIAQLLSQYKDCTILRDEYILAFRVVARKRKEHYVIELLTVYRKKEFKFLYNRFKNFLEKHGEDIWNVIKKLFLDS